MMPEEITTIVIIGASGDLTKRKLLPALFNLGLKKRLPNGLRIVGSARSDWSDDEFRDRMWDGVEEFGAFAHRRDDWSIFTKNVSYCRGDVSSLDGFAMLKEKLESLEKGYQPANRLFYLSIAPQLYETAIRNLGASGLAAEDTGWRRVVIEKPFGKDLSSAVELNNIVHDVFREDQVYRIDHYLGKETVQNLMVFRFANAIFEPIWNRNYVDNVQITVAEEVAVGTRGGYYDQSGVIRDMVQNHLLQLLTIVAMEPPSATDPESLRTQKVEVLRAIRRWPVEEVFEHAVHGQYRGYLDENGVPSDSTTATYAALRLFIDNWRWHGVPFYLRTGKAMTDKVTKIVIQFRDPPQIMFSLGRSENPKPNALGVCIQPDEGLHLQFDVKVPDQEFAMQSVDMEFHYESAFSEQPIPEAYERLLENALEGDPRLFIRNDHIEEAWKIVDPVLHAWEDNRTSKVHTYQPGSWGPEAADALLSEDGRRWISVCGSH